MKRPAEGVCPVCETVFVQPARKQGGGKRTIYCSHKCCALDWAQGNGGKRKASITKYESIPANKTARVLRSRAYTLKKYGWTEEDFAAQLVRQHYACRGCLNRIERGTARIDHDHKTNTIRGLLCDSCNWGLGHLRDNPATLRRLMAHMDTDITKTHVYLIGALKNKRVPDVGNALRARGFDVMDEWFTPGEHADTNWQAYERLRGRSYAEALKGRAATNIFLFDRAYLDLTDAVVLIMPAGKSAMIELGYAKGRGIPAYIFLDGADPDRYDVMPNFADGVFSTEEDLFKALA